MSTFWHILRFKILSFLKTTFDRNAVTAVRGIGSLIVFGGFALSAYALAFAVTSYLVPRVGLAVFHHLVSMVLFVLFVAVNMGNIIVSHATLYKSAEVGYLFTKPVSFEQIFVLKFLDNFLYSSTTFFLLVFAALLGYGTYFEYSWATYAVLLIFVFTPFLFLSACIGVLVLMSLVKVASRWGFRRVVAGLAVVYVLAITLFFRFSNPIGMLENASRLQSGDESVFQLFNIPALSFLPNAIASKVLYHLSRGDIGNSVLTAALLLLGTSAIFAFVLFIGRRFYYRTWLMTFDFQAKSNTVEAGRKLKLFDFRKTSWLPAQWEVLMKKEYFLFRRDASQTIHLALMLVLVVVFALSMRNLNLRLRVTEVQTIGYLVVYSFGGFLSCSLALRFVFPSISLEGKSFWTQLSSPLNIKKVYILKFLLGVLLVMLPALLVAIFSNIPFVRMSERRPLLLYFGIYSSFWTSLTLVSLNLGLGGLFANFKEKNPIRIASSQGATLTFLVSLVYLMALVSIFIIPLTEYFQSLFLFMPFEMVSIVAPGTTLYMLSAALGVFAFLIGLRSLQRDF
jgi:ABC-2 type transport system permease protein